MVAAFTPPLIPVGTVAFLGMAGGLGGFHVALAAAVFTWLRLGRQDTAVDRVPARTATR